MPRNSTSFCRQFWIAQFGQSLFHDSCLYSKDNTSRHGPRTILAPVRFLARKAKWNSRTNFTPVLFPWSHQATDPVRLDMAVHSWFDQIIRWTPHGTRAMPVLPSYEPRTGICEALHILSGPLRDRQGCRTAPLRTRKGIETIRILKIPQGRRMWPHGARMGLVSGRTIFLSKQPMNTPGTARSGPGIVMWLGH